MRLRNILENDLTPTNSLASVGKQAGLPPTSPPAVGQNKPLTDTDISQSAEEAAKGQPQATDAVADTLKQQQEMELKQAQQQQRESLPKYKQLQNDLQQMTADIVNAKQVVQTNANRYDAMGRNLAGIETTVQDLAHDASRPL